MAQHDAIRVLAEMLGAGQSAACGEQGAARNMMVDFFPMVTKWGYRILPIACITSLSLSSPEPVLVHGALK
jgi:hypothetical protein